ncbi:uncharacterized protein [Chironomus tepperi]|uniref:uncharacterized protein n=1 Tax=Chironomus tepperi TaxID=113505 RepID=UPI00391F53D5
MNFQRPNNLEFPKTYYTFKSKSKDSDEIIEYRVQDLPDDRFEEVLEMIKVDYLPEESLCAGKGIHTDPKPTKFLCDIWTELMKSHLSIACFRNDGNDDLVAVNFLTVHSKDDPKVSFEHQSDIVKDVFDVMDYISEVANIYEKYNVDQYLAAYGLCVNRKYRGLGIATEMLKARAPYMKAMGLKITGTAFTAIGSQIAAKKAGYEEYFVMSFEDIKKIDPRFDFTSNPTNTKYYKQMALKIQC